PALGLIKRPGKKEKQLALDALEQVEMTGFMKRQIGELSGGQLHRVFIARALAQHAEIFFLDEPFAGIDMTSEALIRRL
ncbi:ATP-binding cassette domain-containing protein, partial [Clostridioides difficile]|uniref:ATP-binding cassette domain-containing protein n=1 Tax=Clostridioides difficile TaxID=1496 RepID=UPI002358BF86